MKKIAIIFSGDGTNLKYLLEEMHLKDIDVVLTITNNPEANGIQISKDNNVPCFVIDSKLVTRDEFDYLLVEKLIQYNVELTILAGFMRKLTPYFVKYIKAINLHPSLLPANKGLNAIENSFNDSSSIGGITIHYVTEGLDEGDIILQKKIFKKDMSLEEYSKKVKALEKPLLKEAVLSLIK